jgi:hypothetical protein
MYVYLVFVRGEVLKTPTKVTSQTYVVYTFSHTHITLHSYTPLPQYYRHPSGFQQPTHTQSHIRIIWLRFCQRETYSETLFRFLH